MPCRRLRLVPLLALAALLPGPAVAAAAPEVVATGLDNPRGLDVGLGGVVYVTEAGRGGAGPCIAGPDGDEQCAGATGAVTRIRNGDQRRVITGLPSLAGPGGEAATGPQDIDVRGLSADLVVGLGADPAVRASLGELGPSFGRLYRIGLFGRRGSVDLAAYEAEANPDGGEPDSNLTSVLRRAALRYVVDAGGNDLLRVGPTGRTSTVAVFPDRVVPAPPGIPGLPPELPLQSVPTAVAAGPGGALYVSELTGFPFPVGAARIHRVVPGEEPEVYATGFTNLTDLAVGRDGSVYALEFATNGILSGDPAGRLVRIAPDGSRTTVAAEGLEGPYGLALDGRGHAYVSNRGATAGTGEVVRIDLR